MEYSFVVLMIFIVGLSAVIITSKGSGEEQSPSYLVGKFVGGSLFLGIIITLLASIFFACLLMLKYLWIALVG
jgi:hypothetical protein